MQIDRDEALELTRRRMPVLVTGGGRPPVEVRDAKQLPPEPADTYAGPPQEYHRLRDSAGNWTRAGMEHAIRSGGSVMHHGAVITRVEELPDEAELASADQSRMQAEAQRIDGQIAELAARRAHLSRQGQDAADRERQMRTDQRNERLADDAAQSGEKTLTGGHPAGTQTQTQGQQAQQTEHGTQQPPAQPQAQPQGQQVAQQTPRTPPGRGKKD